MNQFGVNQPVRRVEDARFLIENGCYIDDQTIAGSYFRTKTFLADRKLLFKGDKMRNQRGKTRKNKGSFARVTEQADVKRVGFFVGWPSVATTCDESRP